MGIIASTKPINADLFDGFFGQKCPYVLNIEELPGLDGRGRLIYDLFTANIYNPSSDYIIRTMVIRVIGTESGRLVTRDFRSDVYINPLSTGVFQSIVGANLENLEWSILEVEVCDV